MDMYRDTSKNTYHGSYKTNESRYPDFYDEAKQSRAKISALLNKVLLAEQKRLQAAR